MQRATCNGIRIRSPADARVIFHAVLLGSLPMVTRRLDAEERSLIAPGSVYVWEERGPHAELTGVGIERWTDGIRWGPSRVREGFLFYQEKQVSHGLFAESLYDSDGPSSSYGSRSVLVKQTYTVYVDTPKGQRKWHLIAYFTEESVDRLLSIDDIPRLANLHVPHGKYKSARSAKGRPDHIFNPEYESPEMSRLEYVPYAPRASPTFLSSVHAPLTGTPRDRSTRNQKSSVKKRGPGSTTSSDDSGAEGLAPLAYLQSLPPPRRHPVDEKTLMMFTSIGSLL